MQHLRMPSPPDEIERAVEQTCKQSEGTPEELPLHALPIPLAQRERVARLACGARADAVHEHEQARKARGGNSH